MAFYIYKTTMRPWSGMHPSSHPPVTFQSPDLEKSADHVQMSKGAWKGAGRCVKGVAKITYICSIHLWSSQENNLKLVSSNVFTRPYTVSGVPPMIHRSAPGRPRAKTPDFQHGIASQTNISGDQCKCN